MARKETTTIKINKATALRLKAWAHPGQTFDGVIQELIDMRKGKK